MMHGAVEANHAGFTGTGFVNYANEIGSYVEWTVDAVAGHAGTNTVQATATTVHGGPNVDSLTLG